jgi:hypothetical protein
MTAIEDCVVIGPKSFPVEENVRAVNKTVIHICILGPGALRLCERGEKRLAVSRLLLLLYVLLLSLLS